MSRRMILRSFGGASLALAALVVSGWSPRVAPAKIAGTFAGKYAEQHPLTVADADGHVLLMGRVQGLNRSTGPTPYMDQAEVTNLEFADLAQGNGPQQGYITMRSGADTVISRWNGKVTTTLSPDKTPLTRFEGTWTKVKGTGRYQGITGSGTYKGRFTSPTEYTVDWKGEISGAALAEK
jgi:hypothetical protein